MASKMPYKGTSLQMYFCSLAAVFPRNFVEVCTSNRLHKKGLGKALCRGLWNCTTLRYVCYKHSCCWSPSGYILLSIRCDVALGVDHNFNTVTLHHSLYKSLGPTEELLESHRACASRTLTVALKRRAQTDLRIAVDKL